MRVILFMMIFWASTVTHAESLFKLVESERRRVMWAVRDAVPKAGKFPVLIYAPSINNTAFENADMPNSWRAMAIL